MRIQVNLSEKMVEKVDKIAEDMGVSRSALCSTIIGMYVYNTEKSVEIVKSIGLKALNEKTSE